MNDRDSAENDWNAQGALDDDETRGADATAGSTGRDRIGRGRGESDRSTDDRLKPNELPSIQTMMVFAAVSFLFGGLGSWAFQMFVVPKAPRVPFIATPEDLATARDVEDIRESLNNLETRIFDVVARMKQLPHNEPSRLLRDMAARIDQIDVEAKNWMTAVESGADRTRRLEKLEERLDRIEAELRRVAPAESDSKSKNIPK